MNRVLIIGGALFAALLLVALMLGSRAVRKNQSDAASSSTIATATATETLPPPESRQASASSLGFLYGRVTTIDGVVSEGRMRWGKGEEEAFWGDFFNGAKRGNPWAARVPVERLPKESHRLKIFGLQIVAHERRSDLSRRFRVRFGDIVRIERQGPHVIVTLKDGSVFDLDRFEAGEFDDGVRLWDVKRGVLDFESRQIRAVELLPTPAGGDALYRLHGTVHTKHGDFTGFVQWDREECVGTDMLDGRTADGELSVRFDTIRSIARRPSGDGSLVTLLDGRELELSDTNDVGSGNRGIYVDDTRYGRVLVSWDAFERVDFGPGDSGPAYGDFPPARPLTGRVTTRAGAGLAGRIVFDLDESETVELFDAPSEGVDYSIPFGLIASIVPGGGEAPAAPRARVTLQSGEELQLTRASDLGERNAGVLVFAEGGDSAEYVPWADVAQIDLDRPAATYPPIGKR